jgi:hypothetical protein
MDQDEFVKTDPAWWLVDPEERAGLTEWRSNLGDSFGWSDDKWYTVENNLRVVYVNLYDHHPVLLYELDTIKTPEQHEKWLRSFVSARRDRAEAVLSEDDGTKEPEDLAGTWDEEKGMLWTVVGPDNAYRYAYSDDKRTIRPDTRWMSWQEVEESWGPGTWDDSWGMLYRVVKPSNAYQFAYSDDKRTIRPGTEWMSQKEVEQSRGGGA